MGLRTRHLVGLHHVFRRDRENSKQHKFWRFSVKCHRRIRYYAISDYVATHWIAYSKTSPQYTRRIHNAIADNFFEVTPDKSGVRRELGICKDGRIAIYVGRLAAHKGINTILDSLGPVLKQQNIFLLYVGLPDPNVRGTEEMLQQMEQQVAENDWGDRVKFLGYRTDAPRLMASAHVLVHPSRIEGFGLTLVEAMAAGLPLVASNAEGIPEVLRGSDSIMVPPDDPETFREAVLRTLNRPPEETLNIVEKGRKRAQDFRIEKRIKNMVNFFEDVLVGCF